MLFSNNLSIVSPYAKKRHIRTWKSAQPPYHKYNTQDYHFKNAGAINDKAGSSRMAAHRLAEAWWRGCGNWMAPAWGGVASTREDDAQPHRGLNIFVALNPCDMRTGACTLQELVAERLKNWALFVFTNKRRTVLKILYWGGTSKVVLTKKPAEGTFSRPAAAREGRIKLSLTPEGLVLLAGGVDLRRALLRPWYEQGQDVGKPRQWEGLLRIVKMPR